MLIIFPSISLNTDPATKTIFDVVIKPRRQLWGWWKYKPDVGVLGRRLMAGGEGGGRRSCDTVRHRSHGPSSTGCMAGLACRVVPVTRTARVGSSGDGEPPRAVE